MSSESQPKFTHLHVHTHYSLLDGLSKVDELLDYVKETGMDSVAITDHGNMYGAIEFYQKAKELGIKPIIGIEGYVASGDMHDKRPNIDDKRHHIILLAENNTGYKNIIALTTQAHLEGFYYKPRFDKDLLRKHAEGVIALSGCLGAEIPSLIAGSRVEAAKKVIEEYQDIFGKNNFFLEVQSHPSIKEQGKVNEALYKLSEKTGAPVVATQDSHYLRPEDSEAHDVLLAIQTGNKIDDDNRLTLKDDDFSLKTPEKMAEEFPDHPEALENTQKIAERCNVEIKLGEYQLPHFEVPSEYGSDEEYLEKLCQDGLKVRYGENISEEITKRLEYELSIIKKMGFASYFLIVQDFVNWAKDNGIVVGPGRGSAAGSIVSYLLNITNIDPIELNLLFERFLNPERVSMPDIDLDFADTRRDEVLEYVAEKYGRDKVAQIITFGTMAARAAIRDAGRALGYSYDFCDKIAKLIPMFYSLDQALDEIAELKQLYDSDQDAKKVIDSARRLEGVVRHASVHACGVVMTKDSLTEHVPLQRSTQSDSSVITQYEMHAVEDLGLLKMDFLGLKNLTIIENALNEIEARHGETIDIENIPLDDEKTYQLLQKGETSGVFQLESEGMRRYLRELKPTRFEDIIAMAALYRPGPMELIPTYIARKHGREPIKYIHPGVEKALKNTYGVIVYQEQVMDMATELAGLTKGEGYLLIKAVGKKIKKLLDEQKTKFIDGCINNGVSKDIAHKVWELIEPFARYGFNKSHSACYARIAYETAYLKANYPTEFGAALLNAEQKNIDRLAFIIEEVSAMNIELLPPSVNESGYNFTVVNEGVIRFGLAAIKNVGANIVNEIIEERNRGGAFTSLENMLDRIVSKDMNKKSLESLIKAGALDELGERSTLIANMDNLLQYSRESKQAQNAGQFSLFAGSATEADDKLKLQEAEAASQKQKLSWEKELLGFYVSGHPLREYRERLVGSTPINSLLERPAAIECKIGAVIHSAKKIITKKGDPMMFVGLEDLTGKMEAIVFPSLFEKKQDMLEEGKVVMAEGKINTRDGDVKFICENITELA